ncbi:MAG: hypothetical protein EXS09_13035 [Gemmataceae bacterium]|nr:hypothetical protein [Gemmataceae bacterium]
MRLPRLRRWLPIAITLFVLLLLYALWPATSKFTVSAETTYVTDTLDENGFVDYPKALNDRLSQGITPENNAKVLIMLALGPKPEGAEMPPGYFRRLGIDRPTDDGPYLVGSEKFFKALPKKELPDDDAGPFDPPADLKKRWEDEQDRARSWPWKPANHPEIAEWLKTNEKPLAIIAEACKRSKYYNPLLSRNPEPQSMQIVGSLLPSVQKCRAVANMLATRSMLHLGNGDFEGAWQDLMVCQKLGRLLAQGGTMIEDLVGIAIVTIAAHKQVVFLSHAKVPAKQILVWREELRMLPSMPGVADKLDLTERFMMLDCLMTIIYRGPNAMGHLEGSSSKLPPRDTTLNRMLRRSVDYNPTFRLANAMYDRCVAACRLPSRAERKRELDTIEREVKSTKREVTAFSLLEKLASSEISRGEYMGKVYISILLPAFMKIQDAADRTEQTEQNLQVAFALAAYQADNGRYPATLNQLAPKYLAKIPGDLFSGQPLIYRLTDDGYLLYSVGINENDEEGRWTDDQPRGDDLRVRMPAKEPVKKVGD